MLSVSATYTLKHHHNNPVIKQLYDEFIDYAPIEPILDLWDSAYWTEKFKLETMRDEMQERENLFRDFILLQQGKLCSRANQIELYWLESKFEIGRFDIIDAEITDINRLSAEQRSCMKAKSLSKDNLNQLTNDFNAGRLNVINEEFIQFNAMRHLNNERLPALKADRCNTNEFLIALQADRRSVYDASFSRLRRLMTAFRDGRRRITRENCPKARQRQNAFAIWMDEFDRSCAGIFDVEPKQTPLTIRLLEISNRYRLKAMQFQSASHLLEVQARERSSIEQEMQLGFTSLYLLSTKEQMSIDLLSRQSKYLLLQCDIASQKTREILSRQGDGFKASSQSVMSKASTVAMRPSNDEIEDQLGYLFTNERRQDRILSAVSKLVEMSITRTNEGYRGWIKNRDNGGHVFFTLHDQHGYQQSKQNTTHHRLKSKLREAGWIEGLADKE